MKTLMIFSITAIIALPLSAATTKTFAPDGAEIESKTTTTVPPGTAIESTTTTTTSTSQKMEDVEVPKLEKEEAVAPAIDEKQRMEDNEEKNEELNEFYPGHFGDEEYEDEVEEY